MSARIVTGLICAACGKHLDGEPNFCLACGTDLRGITPTADTLSGPFSGRIIDGRYKILEKLGEGGMGTVFKVEHVRMGKMLALKVLRPDNAMDKALKRRFMQEARALARLSSPNTVQVFDHGELDDGSLYIAMEYLPGKDLSWHLRAHGAMGEERALSIAMQVLTSLSEAHSLGIVHRDIKPANVMLVRRRASSTDQVKLLDFGIAKMLEGADSRKSITGVTDFIGTPAYMSPEQGKGDDLDARSDLYSLGAVLFELVTGKEVFSGPTPMSVVTKHMVEPPPRASQVAPDHPISPALEQILLKALAKRPGDRFRDADDMRAQLEKVRVELGLASTAVTPMPEELAASMARREDFESFERRLRMRRAMAPLTALAVLFAVLFGGWRYVATHGASAGGTSNVELEPNDEPSTATRIGLGVPVTGAMGAAAEGESDRDLYVVEVPEGPLRISLSGISDLNLTVDLLQLEPSADGQRLARRLFLDDEPAGHPERVDAFFARAGPLYVRIEERAHASELPRNPREKALVPYTLLVEKMDGAGLEEEPNDSAAMAQSAPRTVALTGFTGARLEWPDRAGEMKDAPPSGRDWFQVEVGGENEKVAVLVVPPRKGKLVVVDGVALEAWLQRRESSSSPGGRAAAPPQAMVLDGKPGLLQLSAAGGKRRVRIQGGDDCESGSAYHLAFVSNGPNGMTSALDLAKTLENEDRRLERKLALELAANEFASSELKAALEK